MIPRSVVSSQLSPPTKAKLRGVQSMKATCTMRLSFMPWIGVLLVLGLGTLMFTYFLGLTKALGFDREDIYSQLARLDSERSRTVDLLTRDRAFLENIEGKKHV